MIALPALFLAASAVLWAYHRAERRIAARQMNRERSGLDQMEETSTLAVVRSEAPYVHPCGSYRHDPLYGPIQVMHPNIKILTSDSELAERLEGIALLTD
jgi:hypothetical protein